MTCNPCTPFRVASTAMLMLILAGCGTAPTPYQAADADGGYAEQRLETGRYRVTFQGNEATPKKTVEDAALFRAAQVAIKADKNYFEVVSSKTEPTPDKGHISALEIATLDQEKPGDDQKIYKARDVIKDLNATIQRPTAIAGNGAIIDDLRKPSTRNY